MTKQERINELLKIYSKLKKLKYEYYILRYDKPEDVQHAIDSDSVLNKIAYDIKELGGELPLETNNKKKKGGKK